MKRKLSAIAVVLIFTFLSTSMVGFSTQTFAAETADSSEYVQYEMPIVTINTDSDRKIDSDEVYTDTKISVINDDGKYEMSDIATSVKLRGNSSMYSEKKSYKLKFGEKQNLLHIGDGKGKTWCLISNCYDGSLLRNLTVYHFAELLDNISYSPNCRSVELYVNHEYQGVYLLCEDVNINKNRVAISEEPNEVENNGYLVEMSRYAEDNKFDIDTATYEVKNDLSETQSIKTQQINYISKYIEKAYNTLKNGNEKELRKYIDLDSLVDIYIGNEIVNNVDAGWDSFYMYKDAGGKLCFGPMWDFDLAMGNANCVKGFESYAGFNPYNVLNVNANSNPWFCQALSKSWFRDLVKKRWNKLQGKINGIPKTIIKEAQTNYKSYCRNFERWDVLGKQVYIEPAEISALKTFRQHYHYLSGWLDNRLKWLTKYINSKDFKNGVFVNYNGKQLTSNSNLLEISPILALLNTPDVDLTYKMLPNIGLTLSIKNGGAENWNTQIDASGFMIEEGAEYVLSFDYSCSETRQLPLCIQQNYTPWAPYYSGELTATKEPQHYETVIKAPASDSNCALIISLGGSTFNGTDVTIDNMSLVKKTN